MKLLCESETSSGNHGNAPSSASSGHPTGANGGRSGSGGGLKLGIVRLGRAAGKVGWLSVKNNSLTHPPRGQNFSFSVPKGGKKAI